jgi:hypothetical protein
MNQRDVDETIQTHFETCREELPKKFVPWTWVVGIALLLLGSIGTGVAVAVSHAKDTDFKADRALEQNFNQDRRLQNLESMQADIRWMRENWGKR